MANDYRQIFEVKRGGASDDKALLADIQRAASARSEFAENIPALIATLRNDLEQSAVRLAALRSLRTAAFLAELFAPYRADFIDALRQLLRPGVDPQLCKDALAFLAAEKDATAQDQLRRGLQDPHLALVPPAMALHLLGFDDHANIADLARDVFSKAGDDLAAKEAALRVLVNDAKSQALFTQLLTDKTQPKSLRALSAAGLNALNPQKFAEIAQNIVKDPTDFEDIRASALGALVNTPLHQVVRANTGFLDAVKSLSAQSPLADLRAAAGRFLAKQ
jgi:hypothetical protein